MNNCVSIKLWNPTIYILTQVYYNGKIKKYTGGSIMEYEKLYAQMVEAAEQAIAAIERADYGQAKQILISAEQRCEAEYLEMEETPKA